MTARITVIVPTYNRAGYLERSLGSVIDQTGVEFQVIVADNASEDHTRDVVTRCIAGAGSVPIRYARRDQNIPWNENFNLAFAEAQTEYAMHVGDDDLLLPGALERAVSALDAHPQVGMLHTAFTTIDEDGAPIDTATDWTKGLTGDTVERGTEFIERTMPWPARVCSPTVVMRRAAMPDVLYDSADGMVSDLTLWFRFALDWDIMYLSTPGLARRVHIGALSRDYSAFAGGEYVIEPEATVVVRTAKLRFIDAHADRLPDSAALRRAASRGSRRDLAAFTRAVASTRREGWRAVTRTVRIQPSVVMEPATWRALAKVVVGPRVSMWIRSRGRP